MSDLTAALPPLPEQAERLVAAGVHDLAGLTAEQLRAAVPDSPQVGGGLLVVHPARVPASALAPLLSKDGHACFVVSDMPDVDDFAAIEEAAPPSSSVYLVRDLDRGDGLRDWSPDEALPALTAAGRSPLTLVEGMHWLLQQPGVLERNYCFMTVGSRLRKPNDSLDARTPALWISNGTGRDGPARRNAPKVGWCWAGNRHTWLGIASAGSRAPIAAALLSYAQVSVAGADHL